MNRTVAAPVVRDEELARILKVIFAEINELWKRMPESTTAVTKQTEGTPGDIRIVKVGEVTYIQARGPDGWVEVAGTKVSRTGG